MRVVVTGAGGQLGSEITSRLDSAHEILAYARAELDVTDAEAVARRVGARPDLVINAAAYTGVDAAEAERDRAFAVNESGPSHLADACANAGIPLVHFSTDYVFNGDSAVPLDEEAPTDPQTVYGASKLAGENAIRARLPSHVIIRTSWVFGRQGNSFVKTVVRLATERPELRIVGDQTGCPTWAGDIAEVVRHLTARLADDGDLPWGTYHYCGAPATTWHGFAQVIVREARAFGPLRAEVIHNVTSDEFPTAARRPAYSVLACGKIERLLGVAPAPWEKGLRHMLREVMHG